jgi:hypothetical protein
MEKNFPMDVSHRSPHRRFRDLIRVNHSCFAVFGLIRLQVLRKTAVMGAYAPADRVLLAELSLHGRFIEAPETLFLHREHSLRSTRALPDLQGRIAWFDPNKAGRTTFPNWRLLVEYVLCIGRVGLPGLERALCYLQLLVWLMRNAGPLCHDLAYPIRQRGSGTGPAVGGCGAVSRST